MKGLPITTPSGQQVVPPKVTTASNEHLFELRFAPQARFLDYRGEYAEQLRERLKLPHWRIDSNRIDVFDEARSRRYFVSVGNCGFIVRDTGTITQFTDHANNFLRFAFELDDLGGSRHILRIGVRSKFCDPFEGTFEDLLERFRTRFLNVNVEALRSLAPGAARLVDIGAPLHFEDEHGRFNTTTGPVIASEVVQYFEKNEGFPDVGLYFDIDYFRAPKSDMTGQQLTPIIAAMAREGWDRHDRIRDLLLR